MYFLKDNSNKAKFVVFVLDSPSGYITIPVASGLKKRKENEETAKITQNKEGSLIIVNVSTPDAGRYLCQAVNKVDESSKFVSLQVHSECL